LSPDKSNGFWILEKDASYGIEKVSSSITTLVVAPSGGYRGGGFVQFSGDSPPATDLPVAHNVDGWTGVYRSKSIHD
jgi:hypothetical protein